MKIFENHHNDYTTVVHGDFCSNGCQFFHKDQANEIFDEFDVSEDHRNDVLSAFGDVTIPDIMSYPSGVRAEVARHECLEILRVLVNDQCRVVRYVVTKHHEVELLRVLVNDPEPDVRREVAKLHEIELLRVLVNDPYWVVRHEVAKHHEIELLRVLVNDPDWVVRREVAKHHEIELLRVLVNDPFGGVRFTAQNTLSELTS